MEAGVELAAHLVATFCELAAIAVLAAGAVVAAAQVLWSWRAFGDVRAKKAIWLRFASSIALALEFALAADLANTAIRPTWDEIGALATIAAIRTGLNYFLAKDIENFRDPEKAGA
jgi:uncharacterized membrane protein